MGLNAVKVGALAGGLARGWMMGAQLQRMERREKRERDRDKAFKDLADLVERYTGRFGAYQPQGDAALAAGGITPDLGAFNWEGADVPTGSEVEGFADGGLVEGEDERAAVPSARNAIIRQGVKLPSARTEVPGPKTADDRIGFGLWRQPALFLDPEFYNQAARIFLKAGMPEGVAFLERGARAQKENAIGALRALLAGDTQGAETAFNGAGGIKIEPGSIKALEGGKYQVTIAGTGEMRTFDPREMLRSFLSPRDFFEIARREEADKATAAHRERTAADLAAHRDRTASEAERHNREREDILRMSAEDRRDLAAARAARGPQPQQQTALQRNTGHLVKIGAAKDEAEAYAIMRQAGGKPEREGISSLAKILLNRPGYTGKDGATRAVQDAATLWRSMGGQQPAAPAAPAAPATVTPPAAFKTPDDVKAAFKAGRLPRAQAESILRNQFGFAQ
jgi:hypothetical protein